MDNGEVEHAWTKYLECAALFSLAMDEGALLRKFTVYLRQHELAVALPETGRVERTLFIADWLPNADMQRRANTGLN